MKDKKNNININLIPDKQDRVIGIFFKWILSIGKIVIIFVELIALAAWIYRIIIDRRIEDLSTQISEANKRVKALEKSEQKYRKLQTKLVDIKKLSDITAYRLEIIKDVLTVIDDHEEKGNTITNITFRPETINLGGMSASVESLNAFIEQLKCKDPIKDGEEFRCKENYKKRDSVISIDLGEIKSNEQGIDFSANIILKEETINQDQLNPIKQN